jgi:hypothetical protein
LLPAGGSHFPLLNGEAFNRTPRGRLVNTLPGYNSFSNAVEPLAMG